MIDVEPAPEGVEGDDAREDPAFFAQVTRIREALRAVEGAA